MQIPRYGNTKCFHNSVSIEGRRGQGFAIFVHNSLHGLVHLHQISDSIQAIWLTIGGIGFSVPEGLVLGGLYISPVSNARSQNDIFEVFAISHTEVMEACTLSPPRMSHVLLQGNFY